MISLHWTVQRLLEQCDVVIPFAKLLSNRFPTHKPESRRAFTHLLSLIKAVAVLHQFQRERDDEGRILATLDDYEVVRQHLIEPIARGLGVSLTTGAEDLLEFIEKHYEIDDKFTVRDLREATRLGKIVYDRISELRANGYVRISEPGAGNVAAKYSRSLRPQGAAGLELPDLKRNMCSDPTGNPDTNAQVLISERVE